MNFKTDSPDKIHLTRPAHYVTVSELCKLVEGNVEKFVPGATKENTLVRRSYDGEILIEWVELETDRQHRKRLKRIKEYEGYEKKRAIEAIQNLKKLHNIK